MNRTTRCICVLLTLAAFATTLGAQIAPERSPDMAAKIFKHPDMTGDDIFLSVDSLPTKAASEAGLRLKALGIVKSSARLDGRSGRFETLLPSTPLIPGKGIGNNLTWSDRGILAPKSSTGLEQAAYQALLDYLEANQRTLRVDPSELSPTPHLTSHAGGEMIQITAPRLIGGSEVRGSYVSATVKLGNLIMLGAHKWSNRGALSTRPWISPEDALEAARDYLVPFNVDRSWAKPERIYLTMFNGNASGNSNGYRYQAAWSIKVNIDGDGGHYEVLVDAHKGDILANEDQNHYAEAKGGVLPVSNDGIAPDGVEQPGWPMPFLNVSTSSGTQTTDTGGNLPATGSMTSSLAGPYIRMSDNCGSISLTQTDGLDFGTSGGTDCTTPGFGGAGNTHSSRTGFYELNKIVEMGRGQLPSNNWLQNQLTSNMNINDTCNAFWGGGTVNFYRSGGGCFNTGEIAGVFDHEWGHGLDDNDANPSIASPSGEGIADIYTALRLNDSCIGRNFRSTVCTGFGDPCLTCTGVRDMDYAQRQSGNPHTVTWSNANCGGSVHCVGSVYSEAIWSLWKRNLQSPPYNMDNNTAHEVVNRLTYIGAGAVGTWFSTSGAPFAGCGSSGGYLNYLAADDDNGNLNDGTPHMQAIFDAFNDQEIACATPTVQESGCSGIPTTAPNVTATPGNQSVNLSWGSVSGATAYQVFRTEGVFACDFGKVKLGETTGTSFADSGLQNGRDYSYVVIPLGGSAACMGPASSCDTVVPASAPDFSVSCSPSSASVQQGDSTQSTCTVTSIAGFSGTVNLSCSGNPSGIGCSFSPSSVNPTGNSTATFNVNLSQATGTFNFDVVGTSGATTRTSGVSITVTPEGQNGPQTAVFDAGLGAPKCAIAGSSCDSTTLLDGRANNGPEPNQPNTLDTCTDGTAGTYHSDESNDRIVITSLDGFDFVEGATVEVSATVWAWTTPSADTLDLYYAADANNPVWTLIGSFNPPAAGAQTLTAQYTLPAGSMQAVRANFRYQGSQSSCSGGTYDDADDLVFTVGGSGPECVVDNDCSDGLFCNGTETCNAGSCQSGTAPNCDDGVSCTVDSCNEGTDSCDAAPNDSLCDNGLFCDGSETCNATLGCQAGTAPNCDDGVSCTVDSCDEGGDSCANAPDDNACDNGLFCDGSEVCNATLGCQDSADPCSGGQTCNETTDICEGGGACSHSADFGSGAGGWTNGADTCTTGSFVVGTPDATAWQVGGGNPGQAFYTQPNPGGIGSADVDGGTCEALSPTVDCNGQAAAAISLDYFHGQRDAGDDVNDGFTIEVLNNGSVVDTIVNIGDVTNNPAWTNVSTVVSNPGDIQLRVRATDAAGGGDIVEGGIDNVSISATTPPSCVVDNDFESGSAGWVNDPASTCTTGDYITGNPTNPGGGQQIVGSNSGVNSIFTAVNTSAGNADVDGGNCILGSPTWAVSAASTLSVAYWHGQRDAGDDASGDFFLLEYSTNGGSSWTTMASNGDSASTAAWTTATASIPAGSNVQLRVQCSDGAGPGDLVECGIDDVSICTQ